MVFWLTADEMMWKGLELCGFDWRRQERLQRVTNLRRFKAHFGSDPRVHAKIWEDLQTTPIRKANIGGAKMSVDSFLMAIYFLKKYPTEQTMAAVFKKGEKTCRKWVWCYMSKIQALKREKVRRLMGMSSFSFERTKWRQHKRMKPEMLRIARNECKGHALVVFRGHIDQEERRRKYIACLLYTSPSPRD